MVMISTPLSSRRFAEAGVMPLPSEEFSPFAMTTSMPLVLEGGESAAQKVAPVAAHHVADT